MSTTQLFFSICGVMVTLILAQTGYLIMYLNAKIGPVGKQVDTLVQYMVLHEGKIATLEERSGGKK